MSIIILTPPPPPPKGTGLLAGSEPDPNAAGTLSTDITGWGHKLESAFLHMIGLEGHRFDSWEALRDFAAAQCAAAAPATVADPAAVSAQP